MSDADLRELERTARARPDDGAAAWAYVRALERAGRQRERLLELARLARGGDDNAQAQLERRASTIRPLRSPGAVRRLEVPVARTEHLVGVLDGALLVLVPGRTRLNLFRLEGAS